MGEGHRAMSFKIAIRDGLTIYVFRDADTAIRIYHMLHLHASIARCDFNGTGNAVVFL